MAPSLLLLVAMSLLGLDVVVTGPLSFLNWVFAFAFPLLPYELFTFMPWAVAYLAHLANTKGADAPFSINALVGFTTLFPAVFFAVRRRARARYRAVHPGLVRSAGHLWRCAAAQAWRHRLVQDDVNPRLLHPADGLVHALPGRARVQGDWQPPQVGQDGGRPLLKKSTFVTAKHFQIIFERAHPLRRGRLLRTGSRVMGKFGYRPADSGITELDEQKLADYLQEIDCSENPKLSTISTKIEACKNLEKLEAFGCCITAIPTQLCVCSATLSELNLSRNKISALPAELVALSALVSIDLSSNQLTTVTDELLAGWTKVEFLYLNDNSLKSVGSLAPLKALYEVRLQVRPHPHSQPDCGAASRPTRPTLVCCARRTTSWMSCL